MLLVTAGLIGGLPVQTTTLRQLLPSDLDVPLSLIVAVQSVQTLVLVAVAAWAGVVLAPGMGLRLRTAARALPFAAAAGLVGGIALFAIDAAFFADALAGADVPRLPLWLTLPGVLYGGIVEEVLLRFGLLTTAAWTVTRLSRRQAPDRAALWSGNVVAAAAFALLHLPATFAFIDPSLALVVRGLVLNGGLGLVFGWLYWRDGLGAAIVAHVVADLALIPLAWS